VGHVRNPSRSRCGANAAHAEDRNYFTAATVTILVTEFFRTRRRPLPAHGWLGLIALLFSEYLMFHGVEPVATYFSPLAWTAYILLADAATFAITGHSRCAKRVVASRKWLRCRSSCGSFRSL